MLSGLDSFLDSHGKRAHMKFYAKSKKKPLSQEKKDEIKKKLKNIAEKLENELTDADLCIINNSVKKIEEDIEEEQKTLREHQEDIIKCARLFFSQYGAYFTEKEKALVIEACRVHDWGKANEIFQAVVNPEVAKELKINARRTIQIPHGFLSAITISLPEFRNLSELFSEKDFRPFITAVYYHHDREDDYDSPEIRKYGKKYYIKYISQYLNRDIAKLYCSNIYDLLFRNNLCHSKIQDVSDDIWNEYVVIKGLLNKFDYTVSAGYEESEFAVDLEEKKLKKQIECFLQGNVLRPAQKYMMEHKDSNLVIIAPTGSGKTEASLLWLDGEKGFYTLPLKVSSNAIYSRIKDKYQYENVALLHSDSMAKYLKEYKEAYKENDWEICEKYDRSRMLAQPLTVCTVDQLFKFVYKALGTEIFAATLKYSKLILDEIQSYEPHVIATIIYGLKMIQHLGGKFAIITATFPTVLKYFMEKYGLVENEQYLFQDFTGSEYQIEEYPRHKIKIIHAEMDLDEIAKQGMNKKVLVICNTVRKAQEIYSKLKDKSDTVWLLHSRYIRRDRALLEKKIMDFSDSDETGIWITTQIVETSLDIDFDVLYTEMCTAEGLLQRLGRCNRKGRYCPEDANVYVYDNQNGVGKKNVYEKELYDRALELLQKYEDIPFEETMKTEYMNEVYQVEAIRETAYFKEIEKDLELFDNINPTEYVEKEIQVREIKSITIVPEKIYSENQNLFDAGIDFLEEPNISREVRSLIRTKLEDLTLGLSLYQRYPKAVDREIVKAEGTKDKRTRRTMNIHRANCKYDFESESGKGAGLLLDEELETDGIFV